MSLLSKSRLVHVTLTCLGLAAVALVACQDTTGDPKATCQCTIIDSEADLEEDHVQCGLSACHKDRMVKCVSDGNSSPYPMDIGPCTPSPPDAAMPDGSKPDVQVADAPADTAPDAPSTCDLVACLNNADCTDAGVGTNAVCLETNDALRSKKCFGSDAAQKTCADHPATSPLLYQCQADPAPRAAACVPSACTKTEQKPLASQDQPCL